MRRNMSLLRSELFICFRGYKHFAPLERILMRNSKLGAFTLQTFPAIMPCTCYQARKISKFLVSLAIQLSTHRGVKRAEKCHT